MSYIEQIIKHFFRHNTSKRLKEQVYHRMVNPAHDTERDKALQEIWNELRNEKLQTPDWENAYEQLKPALQGYTEQEKTHRSFSIRRLQIAATWFIPFVMLCTSAYLFFSPSPSSDDSIAAISYVQHYADIGMRKKVLLPDGSEVWLNAGSSLLYPSTFTTSERGVYLIGEGFFSVKKDSIHPFVVNTHYMKMQVLGTTFNVSAYPDIDKVEATLETGALKIELFEDTVSYYLKPNHQLVYIPSTHTVEQHQVDASDYSDWRMGGLLLDNTSFENALSVLERTYGIKIHVRTSAYDNQKVHVHFNKDESLENIFQILKMMIPELEYKIKGKVVYIE